MRPIRPATAAALLVLGLVGFGPAGCGPSDASVEAAAAARAAEMDAQADRELEETLAVLAEAEAAMRPRTPAPELTYDAFRGEVVDPESDASEGTEQNAVVETE